MKAAGTSSARAGSYAHLTHGNGSCVAPVLVRYGSQSDISRVCCPAVTINGVLLLNAAMRLPIALPVPAAVWTFTSVGLPVACAKPSAIASTEASCKPRT